MSQEILKLVEKANLKSELPQFAVGDTVDVHTRILEGEDERIQIFSGTVIALEHQRMLSGVRDGQCGARWTGDIDILLNGLAVEEHALESRRLDLLARRVESRCAEPDLI